MQIPDGVVVVHKEAGWTSFDVVAKLRNMLKVKKVGHTGTLDPDATGVLCICVGKATKIAEKLTASDKEYETVLLLGKTTDTMDIGGEILSESNVSVSEEEIRSAVSGFIGEQDQIPPMFSAKKVNGKKLYELAREGKVVERKPSHINIYNIEILGIEIPRVRMRINCSKGTYIRTLCNDIGEKLGCGGTMESLVRTKTCGYSLDEALTISQIQMALDNEDITFIKQLDKISI